MLFVAGLNRHYVRLLVLCCLLTSCVLQCLAATQRSAVSLEDIQTDTRLNEVHNIEATGEPIEELMGQLSRQNLKLIAGRSCAEQKLQIRLKRRSTRAVMEALAQMLPGYWTPSADHSGYRLEMSVRALSRRDEWWQLFLGERQKALDVERRRALQALGSDWQAWNKGSIDEASDNQDAQAHADHDLFQQLPPDLKQAIANNLNDLPFYLTPITFRSEQEEGALSVPVNQLPAAWQQRLAGMFSALPSQGSGANWQQGSVLFLNGGTGLLANLALPNGQSLGSFCNLNVSHQIPPMLSLNQLQLPANVEKLEKSGDKVPEAWKRLAAFAQSRFWNNTVPHKAVAHVSRFGPRRADVIRWFSDKADIEFLADYYSGPGRRLTPAERDVPLSRPLAAELNIRAAQLDMSWKTQADGIYLMRNNRWYRDDLLEVPAPVLKRLQTQVQQIGHEQSKNQAAGNAGLMARRRMLDWQADVAGTLTLWQIANGLRWFTPESKPDVPPFLMPELPQSNARDAAQRDQDMQTQLPFYAFTDILLFGYRANCFYATLSAAQRDALMHDRLEGSSLDAGQHKQISFLLPALASRESPPNAPILLGLQTSPTDASRGAMLVPTRLRLVSALSDGKIENEDRH